MSRNFAFAPRLMPEQAAAHYLGFSPSKLRQQGIPRRVSVGNRLYDIRDLDAWADNLPMEGEQECLEQTLADRAFGIAAE
ncbi:MAG TPA: DNA-binding protein [Roseovarius sp.]